MRTNSMFRILDIIFDDSDCSVKSLVHVLVKVFNGLFLCTPLNANMCIVFDTKTTVLWYYASIVHALSINSHTSAIISTFIFDKIIFFNNSLSKKTFREMLYASATNHA